MEFTTRNSPPTSDPLEPTIPAQTQTTSREMDTTNDTTNDDTTDTLETTILAQAQTSNFHLLPPKTLLPQTSGTRKLPNFQSYILSFQTARMQHQTAATIFIFYQSLRQLTNCIPSLKATTTDLLLPRATHHASSKPWTPSGSQHLPALTDILLHLHPQTKIYCLYFHPPEAPTAPTTVFLRLLALQTSSNLSCQEIIQIPPTALTPYLTANQHNAH